MTPGRPTTDNEPRTVIVNCNDFRGTRRDDSTGPAGRHCEDRSVDRPIRRRGKAPAPHRRRGSGPGRDRVCGRAERGGGGLCRARDLLQEAGRNSQLGSERGPAATRARLATGKSLRRPGRRPEYSRGDGRHLVGDFFSRLWLRLHAARREKGPLHSAVYFAGAGGLALGLASAGFFASSAFLASSGRFASSVAVLIESRRGNAALRYASPSFWMRSWL